MPQIRTRWLGSGSQNDPKRPEFPGGVEVERWWVVSYDPLIVEYTVKDSNTPAPSAWPAPVGRPPSSDLSNAGGFHGRLPEKNIDHAVARDSEVLDILAHVLKDYVRRDDPRLTDIRTPTFHGPSHNWDGPDPSILSIPQIKGLSEWMAKIAQGDGDFGIGGLIGPIVQRMGILEQALTTEVFSHTDEFMAVSENRYELTRPPRMDRPIKVFVGGVRNSKFIYTIEDQTLRFDSASLPEWREGMHRDSIIIDYESDTP